ncbi:MAG TPA: flagellar basal-body MS-ring/collar protein FliF [Gammaproteobacteria bacterium]|nr:flagellar basal-body MS-ring/collar protein FliF [Gammaproteobacteria bacterium]
MALVNPENIAAQAKGFNALPVLRQIGLMIGLAGSVALGVAVVLWSRTPDYSMLYGRLSDVEAAQVAASLDSAAIPYRIEHGSGAITVPADKVHEARLKLATRGLPRGDGTGFELLDEKQGFGTSQFMEQARYNRAMEGELARSISTLQSVESARVHLAIPKRSVFVRDRNKPQASVVLKLFAGARLDDERLAGVVHLVAASVEGLAAEDVTVVDQNGRLLTANNSAHGMAASAGQLAYSRKLEQEYIKRIEDILIPIVGVDGVRAQVVADIDYTSVESTTESYQPDDRAVRSEETFEENSTSGMASGVPGALTNQPPPAGTLDGDAVEGDQPGPVNSTRRATRNYELDRSISHTRNLPGAVKQLSVAVLVDYRTQADDKGKTVRVPMDEDEIARITGLVKEAVGFSEERNDSINVSNIPFRTVDEVSEAFPVTPIWQQPWVGGVVKQVIGAVFVLFLLFGVLRPVLRSLALRPQPAAAGGAQGALPPGAAGTAQALGEDRLSLSGQQAPVSPEQQFGMARSMIDNDPRRVAGVVKDWVATDG